MLTLHTLHASRQYLNEEAANKQAKIERDLEKAHGEHADHLAQDHADAVIQIVQQERFLRNQALMSVLSRLTHALLKMARLADYWGNERSTSTSEGGGDEFKKIRRECKDRFGVSFGARHIGFVDRYRRARNRIVHYGGEANSYLPFDQIAAGAGLEGMFDVNFSKNYPEFVSGNGHNAEVDITDELLDLAVTKSCGPVTYSAVQMRAKELEYASKERLERYQAETPDAETPM